jgi:hypothetical protein
MNLIPECTVISHHVVRAVDRSFSSRAGITIHIGDANQAARFSGCTCSNPCLFTVGNRTRVIALCWSTAPQLGVTEGIDTSGHWLSYLIHTRDVSVVSGQSREHVVRR